MPLLLVIFIDSMGLGLVFPILNGLIFDPNSGFINNALYSPIMHYLIYGAIISIFMLCWFFGAAILGDLSDRIGRKSSLIICLIGAFLSYLFSAFAVSIHSVILLLIGRVVAGFTAGSQPIAQAAIIDISLPEQKARNLGYVLLSLSLGFIFGPLLGGVLSNHHLVSWFDFSTPFYFAALISLLNVILLFATFKETFVSKSTTFKIDVTQAVNIFVSAFKHEKIRSLSIIYFIFIFGWSSFYSFLALYLLNIYHFTPTQVSFFMAVMGIGFGVGNGFLVNFLAKRFTLRDNYIYTTLMTALLIFLILFIQQNVFNWIIIPLLACLISVAYASILTLFSDQVDANSQGWVMGVTGSIMALVFAVSGITVGTVAALSATLPIYIAGICLSLSALLTFVLWKN